MKFWHNWHMHSIVQILYASKDPTDFSTDEQWTGPFDTWQAAKQDAVDKCLWELNTAKQMLREVKKLRKPK